VYTYRLAHALADAGHTVDVVHNVDSYHLYHRGDPPTGFPDHPRVARYPLRSGIGAFSSVLSHQTGRPALMERQLQALFDSRPYDVVHYHNISLLGPGVLGFESRHGPTLKLYSTHDHWLLCPTHVLWKFGSRACEKPECLRCVLAARRPPQLWRYTRLLRSAITHVDEVIAPSEFSRRLHAERGFDHPITHLPYFMDTVDTDWQDPGPRPQQRPYFLFVGRLETIKGLHTLINIWHRAPQVDLLIAGTGTQEAALRAQAAENPHIRFLGLRTQQELGPLYVHALACLVPSLTYETFGMVTIEAMARKTPVVARELGPLTEIIQTSAGGLLYRTDEELLDALFRLDAAPCLGRELGEAGYRAFRRYWSREAHLEQYLALIDQAAQRKFSKVPWQLADVPGDVPAAVPQPILDSS
jgi:glycosyltransferase involved in cell wall biosynthesis